MNTADTADHSTSEDPRPQTALEAFYHLYTVDKHDYETELEYAERKIVREQFTAALEEQGFSPGQYLSILQSMQPKAQ